LPNVILGALTVVPLFLLTTAFFDRWTGLLAAGFWSVGVNAITLNRVGKEDTLLVFFMLFACYFYLRAKQTDARETKVRNKNYLLSGISFGLMMASKYFPHYLGLNSLYHHYARVRRRAPGEPSGKTSMVFYIAMAVAFHGASDLDRNEHEKLHQHRVLSVCRDVAALVGTHGVDLVDFVFCKTDRT
ncbi:MAG: glycosyltransferase family 39 protein, partial [Acidobacteria bacterium]|nr:glycosyltransferase family 39 protein [Acidobacteriota bacterium]